MNKDSERNILSSSSGVSVVVSPSSPSDIDSTSDGCLVDDMERSEGERVDGKGILKSSRSGSVNT